MSLSSAVGATVVAATVVLGGPAVVGVAPVGGTAASGEFVSVTSATTPVQPATDDEISFTLALHSDDGNSETVRIERIELRDGDGSDATVLADERYYGDDRQALAPGRSIERSFSIEFDEPGTHDVVVRATVVADGARRTIDYRTSVRVYEPGPRVEAGTEPTTAGERTTMRVTVANGHERPIRDVQLTVDARDVTFDERTRVASSVDGGATGSFGFTATPSTLSTHPVDVTLEYTTADGTRRTVSRTLDVRFRAADRDRQLGVAADVAAAMPGGETTLNLTVANGFDQPLRQFEVRVEGEAATVKQPSRVGTGLDSGAQRTFRFGVSRPIPGREALNVTVAYTTADGSRGTITETLTTTFDAPPSPGEIRLTGVDAVARGGQLEVSATASNVGSTDAAAVVVSIPDGPGLEPTDYFVGSVEGSDFASFTLRTAVTGNRSSVPVEVTYVVGGVEQTSTTDVSVREATAPRQPSRDGVGTLPVVAVVVLLSLVAVVAAVYRRRG